MNWGSVAEWVVIFGVVLSFIVAQVVIYTLLRRDVTVNKQGIAKMGEDMKTQEAKLDREIAAMRSRETAIQTLAACLEKAVENEKEIKILRETSITRPLHDDLQARCQSNIMSLIRENARVTDGVIEDIKEIKEGIKTQAEHYGNIAVAIGQLTVKIEERSRA